MELPTLHVIGVFYAVHCTAHSQCAYTGKALRFPGMMQARGYRVLEYGNEGSESSADEKVAMLDVAEYESHFPWDASKPLGRYCGPGSPGHTLFQERLVAALAARVKPNDFICYTLGPQFQRLPINFPAQIHIETGIGYAEVLPNTLRIFESNAWMHYHLGKVNSGGRALDFVVPNYYDVAAWEPSTAPGEYVAFLGRLASDKGMRVIHLLAERGVRVRVCGPGSRERWQHDNIEYVDPISGLERSAFLGGASCVLAPSEYVEPFGGAAVEAMLCGTPVVATSFGAYTETIEDGVTGFLCHTIADWLQAIARAPELDRGLIARRARERYSIEAVGTQFDHAFKTIASLLPLNDSQ